jgi:hypothetical protein
VRERVPVAPYDSVAVLDGQHPDFAEHKD